MLRLSTIKTDLLNFARNHRLGVTLILCLWLAAAIGGGFILERSADAATDSNIVIVNYDQHQRTIPTQAKTVGQLLSEIHVQIHKGDVVEPSQNTAINQSKFRINVYRAQPVVIIDGTHKTYANSASISPRAIAASAGIKVYAEDNLSQGPVTDFLHDGAVGHRVVIDRATPVNLLLYGHASIVRTHAKTVGDLVKQKGIKLKKGDKLSPSESTPLKAGLKIAINHKGTKYETVTESIPMPVKYVDDDDLSFGTSAVRQHGSDGEREVTYKVTTKNGHEVSRKAIQKVTTKRPIEEIIARGTASNGYSGSRASWLKALRDCESSGNYQTNTGNGFYGAYQFTQATWDSLHTGYARADLAPPSVQDQAIIDNTLRTSGLITQNPGCYYKTGISNKPPSD